MKIYSVAIVNITYFWKRTCIPVNSSEESTNLSGIWKVRKGFCRLHRNRKPLTKAIKKNPHLLALLRYNWYIINCTCLKYTIFGKFWDTYRYMKLSLQTRQWTYPSPTKSCLYSFMSLLPPLTTSIPCFLSLGNHQSASCHYRLVCFIPFVETVKALSYIM